MVTSLVSIEKTKFAWFFSILTRNFPVRIDKKIVSMIVLNLTEMFPVSIEKNAKFPVNIKKTKFAWVF